MGILFCGVEHRERNIFYPRILNLVFDNRDIKSLSNPLILFKISDSNYILENAQYMTSQMILSSLQKDEEMSSY